MDGRLPLPSLLSHALVAFAVEFDNEFERQMPHRTTQHGSTPGSHNAPWLVSMVMWSNFMRFVREEGVPATELQRLLQISDEGLHGWLTRMGKWWGYIVVEPAIAGSRSKRIPPGAVVRPTAAGRMAQAVWRPLAPLIESRWRARFGSDKIDQLRESLSAVVGQLDVDLPEYLPILGYGLFSRGPDRERRAEPVVATSSAPLSALLSKVLLAFAIEFERDSPVSLAISANVLRLAGDAGVRVRDLPRLAGVSKEAIAMSLSFLEKHAYAIVEPEAPGSRVKVAVLTPKGHHACEAYHQLVRAIEKRWQTPFGDEAVCGLRESLEHLVGESSAQVSPLFQGLQPHPDGWRAKIPRPAGLPHYPMVLHRGGFPDGS